MNSNRIYILVILALTALSKSWSVRAQSMEQCLVSADSLYKLEAWHEAFLLYDRIWFYSDTNIQKTIYPSYTLSAFNSNYYETCLSILTTAKNWSEPTLGSDQKLLEVAALFNIENWSECAEICDTYMEEASEELTLNLYYFKCLCYAKLNQKDSVETCIKNLKSFANKQKQFELDSIYNLYQTTETISIKKVQLLSLLIPGLGQLYQKEYKQSLNAFTLNTLLIGAFGLTAQIYNWPQAILFWVYYVPHYYLGNAKSAKELALKNNERTNQLFFETLKKWEIN